MSLPYVLPLGTKEGWSRLRHRSTKGAVNTLELLGHLESQQRFYLCGVYTLTSLLNAWNIHRPVQPWIHPHTYWTDMQMQHTISMANAPLSPGHIQSRGLQLRHLVRTLDGFSQSIRVHYPMRFAPHIRVPDLFHSLCRMQRRRHVILMQFERMPLFGVHSGHFGLATAYHPPTQSVLLLDVTKYRYDPAVWVPVSALVRGLQTRDSDQEPRGWVALSANQRVPQGESGTRTERGNKDGVGPCA